MLEILSASRLWCNKSQFDRVAKCCAVEFCKANSGHCSQLDEMWKKEGWKGGWKVEGYIWVRDAE